MTRDFVAPKAEPGPAKFCKIGGDVIGSWKPAPVELFARAFEDAISPGMIRHSRVSRIKRSTVLSTYGSILDCRT